MTTFTVAGGCFWCIDAVYRRIKGMQSVISGYTGGSIDTPRYYDVATGQTGHAEAVQITFDETIIPADTILDLFFLIHDPTTLNRQGADVGTQYRSALFYVDEAQKTTFEHAIERAASQWDSLIVTELSALETFYAAEDEHQDYFNKNPGNGYCSVVITPKIVKARAAYAEWFL